MTDIVERAKEARNRIEPGHWSGFPPAMVDELIAEIERLRGIVDPVYPDVDD